MPLSSFVLPGKITQVQVLPAAEAEKSFAASGYDEGFSAGYKQGLLQAQLEAEKKARETTARAVEVLTSLEEVHHHALELAHQHFPGMLEALFSRLLLGHTFQQEEIAKEVERLLHELSLAESVLVELGEKDLKGVQDFLHQSGRSLADSRVKWKINTDLKPGEVVITSDLGVYDGRHLNRVHKAKAALHIGS